MDPDETANSQDGSEAEDEPLIPEDIDENFYNNLSGKINDIIRYTRNKLNNAVHADNIQRIQLVCTKYKSDFHQEELKCSELKENLNTVQNTLDEALKKIDLDRGIIHELKGVIEKAWRQKDSAQARDQAAQEELHKLRDKVNEMEITLQRLAERRGGMDMLGRLKEDDNKEREKLNTDLKEINKKLQIQRGYSSELEQMIVKLEEKNKGLIAILDETSSECYSEKKKLSALTKEFAEMKICEEKNDEKMKKIQLQNDHLNKQHIQQNLQLLAVKTNLDQLRTLYNSSNNKLTKSLIELELLNEEREKLKMDLLQKTNITKVREEEFYKMKQENSKITRSQDGLIRKMKGFERAKDKGDVEISRLRNQVSNLEKELGEDKNNLEKLTRKLNAITNERDHLKEELITKKILIEKSEENFVLGQQELKLMNDKFKTNILKEKKLNEDLIKSKHQTEKKLEEIQKLCENNNELKLQNRYKETLIDELKQEMADIQGNFNTVQGNLDLIRNEKKTVERKLQQSITENESLKEEIQTANDQLADLKDKIIQKAEDLNKLQIQIEKMQKERQLLKIETKNTQVIYQHSRSELIERRLENDRLNKVFQENEQKLVKSKKLLDNCIHDKNVIESNLTKLNEILEQTKSHLQLTQNSMEQCERSYGDSLENIRIMKTEIRNLLAERDVLKRDRECSADLRTELLQTHRVLNQERIKARALQDELLTPINIHRWRTLGGKDPEKMDLINKIQILQKQILAQNVSAMEREKTLEESHKLYTALRQFVMKLPSYKIKEQLSEIKNNLSVKQKKLKAITAELNTKEIDEKSKEVIVEELRTNLSSAKKELSQEKKKKMKLLEERHLIAQMQLQYFSAPSIGSRIFGAGYKMSSAYTLMG